MSKYDGLNESECRQLLQAKLEMLARWAAGNPHRGLFSDMETNQYHEALHDAEDLVKFLNRSYNQSRMAAATKALRTLNDDELTYRQ